MSFDPATALIDLAKVAIEKVFPDPLKRAEQLERLERLRQEGDLAKLQAEVSLLLGQIEINKVEAAHPSVFVSGWRPFIGWIVGVSLFMYYVPYALVSLIVWTIACYHTGSIVERPNLDISDLIGLLSAMLGVVVPRSIERIKGVAIERVTK